MAFSAARFFFLGPLDPTAPRLERATGYCAARVAADCQLGATGCFAARVAHDEPGGGADAVGPGAIAFRRSDG